MPKRRNARLWAALLALTLLAWILWYDGADTSDVVSSSRKNAVSERLRDTGRGASGEVASKSVTRGRGFDRDPIVDADSNPFKVVNFVPPPIPAPVVAAPIPSPKPMTPTFPYKYFGRMVGLDGKSSIYLSKGEMLVTVRERDVLDQMYRIDTITDSQINMTYLPLDEKLTLATPSASH